MSLSKFFLKFKRRTGQLYIPELDGLRFLAIFIVVSGHLFNTYSKDYSEAHNLSEVPSNGISEFLSHSLVGVLLFFCISGFILCYPILMKLEEGKDAFSWKPYLWRRINRIEPPYVLVLSIFFVGRFFTNNITLSLDAIQHYFASLFYVHNIIYGYRSIILPVAWSLEIEVQFYLLAPIFCMVYSKFEKKHRRIFMLILIFVIPYIQYNLPLRNFHLSISILNYVQYFLAGLLAADLYLFKVPLLKRFDNLLFVGAFVSMIISSLPYLYLKPLMPFVLIVLLLMSIQASWGKQVFGNKLLYTIGGLSYSIYLIHMPFLFYTMYLVPNVLSFWVSYLIALMISGIVLLFVAIGFYYFFERPFMVKEDLKIAYKN